jgi:hypothetical protein
MSVVLVPRRGRGVLPSDPRDREAPLDPLAPRYIEAP